MKKLFYVLAILQACSSPTEKGSENTKSIDGKTVFELGGVFASNQFSGARLNDFTRLGEASFQATISPENIPVNASAWYAFQIWSDTKKEINLSLNYTHHKHRFIPKLSRDGKNWVSFDKAINLNEDSTTATISIQISPDTLWVSAQEIHSSQSTYHWVNQLVKSVDFLDINSVGRSALSNDIFVVSSENSKIDQSVVLIARQHPPEVPGGSIAFKAFFEEVMSVSELAISFRQKFNVYTFPLLNPDGADLGNWRHNANGADLNRDWVDFKQPETQVVRDFITSKVEQENKTISFGIDFHTSYSGPYLLILDSANEARSETKIIPSWIERIDVDSLKMNDYRRRDQELPYCYNWFYNQLGSEAVTYEEGDEIDRDTIKKRAILYAQKWMESMLTSL